MPDSPPQLSVRKLTLFSHGVANLQLSAEIQDDANLHLSFPERHMNDVLKTLTVVDTAGHIGSISYEAPSQLNRNPPVLQVNRQQALETLLENAQGAKVVVQHRELVTGTVLGLQWLPNQSASRTMENGQMAKTLHLVLMQDGCRMLTFDVTEIDSIRFMDDQIQKQLDRRMQAALTELRSKNNKNVTITARGSGTRTVLVNYAVESPVPKLTYRFLLKSTGDESQADQQMVFVQAWAIVDNPTDEDLQDIDVSIVSGLPISFKHDLYGARFVERPLEEVPLTAGYNKPSQGTIRHRRVLDAGIGRGRGGARRKILAIKSARGGASGSSDDESTDTSGSEAEEQAHSGEGADWQDLMMNNAQEVPAETREVGDLFEYNIPVKVTIRARESALVPLIAREVDGGRVDVYSHKVRESNSLSAVRIRNSTDSAFEGGPVAVYEHSRLVGEGMLKACRPGREQFLPYSVNLDCLVEMKREVVDGDVVSTVALGGYFKMTREREYVKRYSFRNVKKEDMDLHVLHDSAAGFSLHSATVVRKGVDAGGEATAEGNGQVEEAVLPVDVSKDVARYRVKIGGEELVVLRVSERKREATSYRIRKQCTEGMIGKWKREGTVGKKTVEKMEEVLKVEVELAGVRRKIREYKKKLERMESSQQRFRENLSAVGGLKESKRYRDDALIGRLLKGLAESESSIEETEALLKDAEEREAALQKEIEAKVGEFGSGELRDD